uniref:SFRICE_039116 n=1 Tax=Spodoptera frugiperda TaxID=7108 RepID=A0A2H1WMQ3_SPOFR
MNEPRARAHSTSSTSRSMTAGARRTRSMELCKIYVAVAELANRSGRPRRRRRRRISKTDFVFDTLLTTFQEHSPDDELDVQTKIDNLRRIRTSTCVGAGFCIQHQPKWIQF